MNGKLPTILMLRTPNLITNLSSCYPAYLKTVKLKSGAVIICYSNADCIRMEPKNKGQNKVRDKVLPEEKCQEGEEPKPRSLAGIITAVLYAEVGIPEALLDDVFEYVKSPDLSP